MPTANSNNTYIQQALADIKQSFTDINVKFDNFIATLPSTYVTIRNHDLQIKAHETRIDDNAKRLDALEDSFENWKKDIGQWSLTQHDNMRKEWTGEVKGVNSEIKDVNTKLDEFGINVVTLASEQKHLTDILKWVLGIFATLTIAIITGIVVAFATHLIHL